MECDKDAFNRFFHAMLEDGVYLAPSAFEAGFVSAAHSDADIDDTIRAAAEIFAQMGYANWGPICRVRHFNVALNPILLYARFFVQRLVK